jgi:Tfp pilus assembly protein PilF
LAQKCFEKALEIDADCNPEKSALTFFGLALSFSQKKMHDTAEYWYRKSLERVPKNHDCLFYLGITLWYQHRYAEAEAAYRKAIEIKPDSPNYFFHLGTVLLIQDKKDYAEAALHTALDLDPQNILADQILSEINEEGGFYILAIAFAEAVRDKASNYKEIVEAMNARIRELEIKKSSQDDGPGIDYSLS